jgi:hypothetical protein
MLQTASTIKKQITQMQKLLVAARLVPVAMTALAAVVVVLSKLSLL